MLSSASTPAILAFFVMGLNMCRYTAPFSSYTWIIFILKHGRKSCLGSQPSATKMEGRVPNREGICSFLEI